MSVGDFNLTKKGFSKAIKKHDTILVEFTSPGCLKCIRSELEYVKVHEKLQEMKVTVLIRLSSTRCCPITF